MGQESGLLCIILSSLFNSSRIKKRKKEKKVVFCIKH